MILSVEAISKRYRTKIALNEVTLSVNEHEIVGLIGPNGSGKTTLLNIICGFVLPDSGSMSLKDPKHLAMSISRKGFFNDMTVLRNLELYARLKETSKDQLSKTLEDLEINYKNVYYGKLSAGMKQRVSLSSIF